MYATVADQEKFQEELSDTDRRDTSNLNPRMSKDWSEYKPTVEPLEISKKSMPTHEAKWSEDLEVESTTRKAKDSDKIVSIDFSPGDTSKASTENASPTQPCEPRIEDEDVLRDLKKTSPASGSSKSSIQIDLDESSEEDTDIASNPKLLEAFKAIQKLGYVISKDPNNRAFNPGTRASRKSEKTMVCPTCQKFRGRPCEVKYISLVSQPPST